MDCSRKLQSSTAIHVWCIKFVDQQRPGGAASNELPAASGIHTHKLVDSCDKCLNEYERYCGKWTLLFDVSKGQIVDLVPFLV